MKGGMLKLLLLTNPSEATTLSRVTFTLLSSSRRYSSLPKRPTRGGRRDTEDKDSGEEEFFLRNLNFGDDNASQSFFNSADTDTRPARGESRQAVDSGRKIAGAPTSPWNGILDRPMRGDRRERPPRRQTSDFGGDRSTGEETGAPKFDFRDKRITFDREEYRNSDRKITGTLRNTFGGNADRPMRGNRRERPPRWKSSDLGGDGSNIDGMGTLELDFRDQSIMFDPEESDDFPVEDSLSRDSDRKIAGGTRGSYSGISDRPSRGHRTASPLHPHSFDLGSGGSCGGSTGEEMPGRKLDFGDQAITFEKEEKGGQPGPSLNHKLKFTDDADRKEEKEGEKACGDSSPAKEHVPETSVEDADVIFSKLKKNGLIPNAVAMLDGLCKDGLIQEAMKLFGLMREKGTIPEVVIYTAVVEGFCRAGKYDDAKRIFRKMQKNDIVPNAFSFGIIIQGLCKGRRWDDCVDFCLEMLDSGHSPNVVTFVGLVDGICKDKGVEEAEKMLKTLRERNLAVDEKAVRDHMDKKGPYSPVVWEAIFGKKGFKTIL